MNVEDDLRRALKREPAPEGFADRVIAHVERDHGSASETWGAPFRRAGRARRVRSGNYSVALRWLAAAAAVVLMTGGAVQYYEYQQTVAEAKRVEAEIRLAMQIASETLARVQEKLQETNR